MSEKKWYLRTQDETFGPETEEKLVEWAKLGRIQPGQEISDDNIEWRRVEDVPFLDMRYSIDIGDGNPRGPFHRAAAEALLASGRLPKCSTMVEVREPFDVPRTEDAPPPETNETPVAETVESSPVEPVESTAAEERPVEEQLVEEKTPEEEKPASQPVQEELPIATECAAEKVVEKIVEVPVEKIVEKIVEKEVRVEVPVEKIVEKVVEKEVRVEVPVEKIVEKVVVDETRVKELEGSLRDAQARESRISDQVKELEGSLKDAADRENKYSDQVTHLEDELRRLPQAASEVADIQAAVYSIMTGEAADIATVIEQEKKDFEQYKRRHLERIDRLLERRREMLRRSGANIEDMTHRALLERPEDPRLAQLRRDFDELRHTHDFEVAESRRKVCELEERLRVSQAEISRHAVQAQDAAQMQADIVSLREQLQRREKELMDERQRNEALQKQQATRQQTLMARLASLESPSIGTASSLSTNQSREARQVKLPSWMRLGK